MKRNSKTIIKRVAAGLMALTLAGPSVPGGAQVAYGAPAEDNGVYYTWHRLESLAQLEQLFADKEGRYTVANSKGEKNSIPIMIMANDSVTGTKYVFNSPGEEDQGTKNEMLSYGEERYDHETNWPSAVTYSCTPAKDLPGFCYSDSTDTVITGDVEPFFLENTAYVQKTYPKGVSRPREYQYQLHTCKRNAAGEAVPSEKMLMIGAGYDGEDHEYWCSRPNLAFGEVTSTPVIAMNAHCTQGWNLEEVTVGNRKRFRIGNYYYGHIYRFMIVQWKSGLIEMKTNLSLHRSGVWFAHAGMYATQDDWAEGKDGFDSGDTDWESLDYYYTHKDYSDSLEIWYGVKGIEKSKLKAVNGENYFSKTEQAATGFAAATELGNKTVGSGEVLSLPVLSFTHLGKGKTLTIEAGGTLILSRNAVLLNDGQIVNHGTVVVQPGAVMGVNGAVKTEKAGQEGSLTGNGEMLVRSGGKVVQTAVAQDRIESAGILYSGTGFFVGQYRSVGNGKAYYGDRDNRMAAADVIGLTMSDLGLQLKLAGCCEIR